MTDPLLSLFTILAATFVAPFSTPATASEPIALPLPKDFDERLLISSQLLKNHFSSDPTQQGIVLSEHDTDEEDDEDLTQCDPEQKEDDDGDEMVDCRDPGCWKAWDINQCVPADDSEAMRPAHLEVQMIYAPTCLLHGDYLTFRIIITNTGEKPAMDVVVTDIHPNMPIINIQRLPDFYSFVGRTIIWRERMIKPGQTVEYSFQIPRILDRVENTVIVEYFDSVESAFPSAVADTSKLLRTEAYKAVNDECFTEGQGGIPEVSYIPRHGEPKIICDPGEIGCQPTNPKLGTNFGSAQPQLIDPNQGPLYGPTYDPGIYNINRLPLGVRYREAVADIQPGECRVIPDDVIIHPDYHDALARDGAAANSFIMPLYRSGQDFKRLVQENVLLGITSKIHARKVLSEIHSKHWMSRTELLQEVLDGTRTTNNIRAQINQWEQGWVNETKTAQQDLATRYATMQGERKGKFDPTAQTAVRNATDSIGRSCPRVVQPPDGGLSTLLGPVKVAYELSLAARQQVYQQTQSTFADSNSAVFPIENQAITWQQELRAALDAFDAGNPAPLRQFISDIPHKDAGGFRARYNLTYEKHTEDDYDADERVRLLNWEIALDAPKIIATECVKEKLYSYHVAITWCESGTFPELVVKEAPVPVKARLRNIFLPDTSDLDGTTTVIDSRRVVGSSCSGRPGDPWWTDDCSCQCGELLPVQEGNIVPCGNGKPITRHDYFVVTQAECLNDPGHQDPFL